MEGRFPSLGGWTALNWLLAVRIWLVALIILPPYSAGPSPAFPFYGMAAKKKLRCCLHSLCLLESCMRNTGHTRIKKMPKYYGQNMNLKPFCCCQGWLSRFPQWKGREGKVRGSAAPTWCRQGRNPSQGSIPGLSRRDGTPAKAGAVTTLRHTLFPFRTGRNHLRARASFPG